MEFKLERPHLSNARCAACEIMGGITVADKDDADTYSKMLDRRVDVGEQLLLDPCEMPAVLEVIQADYGRPCPRVDLEPENIAASHILAMLLRPQAQVLVQPMIEAALADESARSRREILVRIMAALQSPAAMRALYPERGATE